MAATQASMIDWELARRGARRLAPSGPTITGEEAAAAVAELRECAASAPGPVAETSLMQAPPSASPAVVVDRGRWIDANVATFQAMFDPIASHLLAVQAEKGRPAPPAAMQKVGGVVTGSEVAGLLAYLSSKILGQYDLAPGRPASDAALLLVAPNIVMVERELGAFPKDFRMWVCLHEETHRVQFTAVPWLRDYMLSATDELGKGLIPDPDDLLRKLTAIPGNARAMMKPGSNGLAELLTTPEQREQIAQITAVMALLEGHADVIMDEVGPQVIPSVEAIRASFETRRRGAGLFDVVIRRLLGLEAKLAQYRDGAGFVRGVVGEVGFVGFNAVWTGPDFLPTPSEIADPHAWVRRVHG